MDEQTIIEMMSVLAEPMRVKILKLISSEGEMCAKDIQPMFSVTQPTLSHHLNLLLEEGMLDSKKVGRFVYYSVNKEAIGRIAALVESLLEPPVVRSVKKSAVSKDKAQKKKPALKKTTSVPQPKIVIASPDLEKLKKNKKKKKDDKKKKDKEKDKKKKK